MFRLPVFIFRKENNMAKDSIKISEKHGVNPTIPICFYCGEDKNEVALLDKLKGDVKAPMRMLLDYVPCDKCKEKWAEMNAIILVGVQDTPVQEGQPPIDNQEGKDLYPTGSYVGVTEQFIRENIDEDMQDEIIDSGLCVADNEIVEVLLEKHKCPEEEGDTE